MPKGKYISLFEQKCIYEQYQTISNQHSKCSFTALCKRVALVLGISHLSVMRIVHYFNDNGCFKPVGKPSGRRCIWKNDAFLSNLKQYLVSEKPTLPSQFRIMWNPISTDSFHQ